MSHARGVDSLYRLRLEEGIEHEAQVLRLAEFYGCRASEYGRQPLTVKRQVEEIAALVVTIGSDGEHVAVLVARGLITVVVGKLCLHSL